jgi:VanZ family protein
MLKRIKNLLKDNRFIIAVFITVSILVLSLTKMPKYNIPISNLDKWQHTIAYFVLSISWLFAFYKKDRKQLIIFSCILFGIVIEVLQYAITNYRIGDYADVIANCTGILLGLFIFNQIIKKNEVKKQKDL